MSYTYLQEQGEGSSAESFADIPQFVLSRLNLTAEKSYSKDNEMESYQSSQSGTMCKPSMETRGEEKLMLSAEDSHAKTYQQQEKEQELKDQDQVCGSTWRESLVKFDLNTLSWKTHRCLWEEDLEPSSLTLPKWGMMRSGVLWERIMSPLHTEETESGLLLPTPTCADATMGAILNDNTKFITLKTGKLRKISNQGVSGSIGLARTVAMWPTPTCHMSKEQDSPSEATRNTPSLTHLARGGDKTQSRHLNPTWVEKLMGWPQNWTEVKPMIDFQFISWIMGFCECENTRTKEIMRVLRNSNGAQNFQRKAGRPISIQEAEILLSLMFQHEIGSDEAWLLMEGEEAPQGEVRGVRIQAGIASSPHRPGHQEQPAGEYPDAMQTLSRLLAYDGEAAWKDQSWENAVPRVATGVASRVDRLKAIGNGQVPAVAALAWKLLKE
jgi:hypothetical protein